jgi:two-component system sensor histidine kinase BaeS
VSDERPQGPAALWTSFKVRLAAVVGAIVLVVATLTTAASAAGAPAYAVVTVSVLVALVLTHTLARGMTVPVREMTAAATAMAQGDYSTRVGVTASDEIGDLARAFNAMAEELQTEDRRRRELVATVSHELRTPVAALRATLENLADGVVAPGPDTLGAPLRQAERLSAVVGDLLDLSRLDAGLVALDLAPVDAAGLLGRVADEARLATRRQVEVVAESDHGLRLTGDERRLHQLLANLTDNAVRHSPDGGTVTLSARARDGGVVLEVHDQGPGIPPEHREAAFRRFTTGLSGPHDGGTGLGLAVAHWVTVLHGGRIRVVDDERRPGCVVRVELPAAPPTRPAPPTAAEEAPVTTTPAPATPAPPASRPSAMDAAFGDVWPEVRSEGRPSAVLTALGVGLVAGALIPFYDVGLGWWLVLVAMIGTVAWTARHRLDPFGRGLLALAGSLTLPVVLLDAGWIVTLCILAAGVLTVVALTGAATVLGFVLSPVAVPLGGLRGLPWLGRSLETGGGAVSWRVARTALVSLALVLVFGTLLASADALYGSWLGRLVPDLRVDTLFARGFATVFVGGVTLAASYVALNPPRVDLADVRPRARHAWEWLVPVVLVDVLLAGFGVAQATALFGGRDYVERTVGMTYADYVHQGFGQLCVVTVLTLGVAAAAWRAADREADLWRLRAAVGVLCALALMVVGSALMRIGLYDDAYGWTRLRVLVAFFEAWLGLVVLLVVAAGILRRADWVPRTALATGGATLLLLAALNPDARIAEHNLTREGTVPVDTAYLVGLSQDAVPSLPGPLQEEACDRHSSGFAERTGRHTESIWSWNLGRWRADRACG